MIEVNSVCDRKMTLTANLSRLFVQLKQLMVVGIDCYHDTTSGKRSVGALVASLNQSMTRLVSTTEMGICE